jgi:hypothetical protein
MLTLAFALLSNPAEASRAPVSRAALCARASAVVVAEVTGSEGQWSADPTGGIETWWDLAVTRTIRGEALADLRLRTPGGSVGGLTQTISEAPRLRTDARFLLLLSPSADGWQIVGGADGVVALPWDSPSAVEDAVASLGACRA